MSIALIGAGAAGAACVSVLRSRGAEFSVFEKSRGVGGRLTTRRVSGVISAGDLSYDHGAGKFSLDEKLIHALSGSVGQSTLQPFAGEYVAQPTMPQLIKDLLGPTKINTLTEIEKIEGKPGEWWLVIKIQDNHTAPSRRVGPFSKIVCTAPAPQALKLLAEVNCSWKEELKKITYDPCWALLFTMRGENTLHSLASDEIFSALTQQSTKSGRTHHSGLQSWVAHAGSSWSWAHLEETAEQINALLLPKALDKLASSADQVVHSTTHRWRFATVRNSLGVDFLYDESAGLFYAGDGCHGRGIAGALQSGLSVAGKLLI